MHFTTKLFSSAGLHSTDMGLDLQYAADIMHKFLDLLKLDVRNDT